MRDIYLKVFTNKKIICLNPPFKIGRKSENESTVLNIQVPAEIANYYNFLIFKSPSNVNYIVQLNNNLQYIVEKWITDEVGTWTIEYISTSQEDLASGVLDASQAILISEDISAIVEDSIASEDLNFPPTPEIAILETRLERKIDEIVTIVESIKEDGLAVDVTQIVDAIEAAIRDIEIHADVDMSSVLSAIDASEATLLAKMDNINVDLTPIQNALSELRTLIVAIPTTDYTQKLNTIESKIDAIDPSGGGKDYTAQLNRMEGKIDTIPTTDNTQDITAIKNKVNQIPTNDYTSKLNTIENKIDTIPTTDYTSDITAIKNNQQRTDQYDNYVWNEQTQDYDINFIDVVMKQADDLKAIRDAVADRPIYENGQPSSTFTQNTAMDVLYMLNTTIEHTVLLQLTSIMQSESRIETKLANVETALNDIVGGNS